MIVRHPKGSARNRVVIGMSGDAVAATFAYRGRLFKLDPRADGSHVLSEVNSNDPAPEVDPVPVAETNQAYADSGMSSRLNLVGTVRTSYTESGNMSTDLSRLRGTNDGYMDELHALRNSYGADLVSLIEDEPQYCGIAYRMSRLSSSFASSAFSVVHRTCATGYYSFAHEIGHNQGAHHNPANASGAIYPYAYGHQEPYGKFRTVMAYNCSGGCSRVNYFSNPDVFYSGEPTGALNAADNARTIDGTAATVADFRQRATQNPPVAPSGLSGAATSDTTISLEWTDRSDDGLNFAQLASLPANTTGYLDDTLEADTLYYYRARSWNSAGNSDYSNVTVVATEPAPAPLVPSAPTSLSASADCTDQINLTWADRSDNESGFAVERRTDGSSQWSAVRTTGANATAYTNSGLQLGTLYYYRVTAFNSDGSSDYSDSASARTAEEQVEEGIESSVKNIKSKGTP